MRDRADGAQTGPVGGEAKQAAPSTWLPGLVAAGDRRRSPAIDRSGLRPRVGGRCELEAADVAWSRGIGGNLSNRCHICTIIIIIIIVKRDLYTFGFPRTHTPVQSKKAQNPYAAVQPLSFLVFFV